MTKNEHIDMCPAGISGLCFELGEEQREIEKIEGAKDQFKAFRLPMNMTMLGCKYYRRAERTSRELLSETIRRTLAETGQIAADIDMLIIASASILEIASDKGCVASIIEEHGLVSALPLAVTLKECTSLLGAIDIARRYVETGGAKNVLVASVDVVRDESARIKPFGVMSDAAASCLISCATDAKWQIMGYANKVDLKGLKGEDDFTSRRNLADMALKQVLASARAGIGDIKKVFATNFYLPVARFNASSIGLKEAQLSLETAQETGHCVCADPLISLCRHVASQDAGEDDGALYLLQSYAPGFLACLLIKQIDTSLAVSKRV